jgi:hypothetical protein
MFPPTHLSASNITHIPYGQRPSICDSLHRGSEARMELWACGFNAWGQLGFGGKFSLESPDLNTFKCVFKDQRIEILHMGLSSILRK